MVPPVDGTPNYRSIVEGEKNMSDKPAQQPGDAESPPKKEEQGDQPAAPEPETSETPPAAASA
jgi:hypothetical protein